MATQNTINKKTQDLTIDPGATGDSFVQFDINGTGEFRIGVDDTNDSFCISQGSALGTNDTFVMSDAGERRMPLHPAAMAYSTTSYLDVTGNGTAYSIIYTPEIFDQNSHFASSTFTAPIDGKYHIMLNRMLMGQNGSGGTIGAINIITSNRTYYAISMGERAGIGGIFGGPNNYQGILASVIADMDASDTATVTWTSTGGSKLDDVRLPSFSCHLVC